MSFADIWATLKEIDCTEHVKKKGQLDYLPWAWAWGILMEHYPDATFQFLPEQTLANGTVECCCIVTIEGHERHMWLPVMDYKNESLESPTSRAISDARMRCFVKTLALFGLGHSLYAGEDVPDSDKDKDRLIAHITAVRENLHSVVALKDYIAQGKIGLAYEAWNELETDDREALWRATTKGSVLTTAERALMKSNEWNDAHKAYHNLSDD